MRLRAHVRRVERRSLLDRWSEWVPAPVHGRTTSEARMVRIVHVSLVLSLPRLLLLHLLRLELLDLLLERVIF